MLREIREQSNSVATKKSSVVAVEVKKLNYVFKSKKGIWLKKIMQVLKMYIENKQK